MDPANSIDDQVNLLLVSAFGDVGNIQPIEIPCPVPRLWVFECSLPNITNTALQGTEHSCLGLFLSKRVMASIMSWFETEERSSRMIMPASTQVALSSAPEYPSCGQQYARC